MYTWDEVKNKINQEKHGVRFEDAVKVFQDPKGIMYYDEGHSQKEDRYHCVGKVDGGIMTVRFVLRESDVRIIGAGYWRKGKKIYDERN